MSELQKARVANKPMPVLENLSALLLENWQLEAVSLKILDSYDDANFFLRARLFGEEKEFLVKFYNAVESRNPEFLRGLSQALGRLGNPPLAPIKIPNILFAKKGSLAATDDFIVVPCRTINGDNASCAVRVFHWIRGDTLNSHAAAVTWLHFFHVGDAIGRLQDSLHGFDHPALHRAHIWDLRQFSLAASDLISFVPDTRLQQVIRVIYQQYQLQIPSNAFQFSLETSPLPWSVIMGDANDANLIVDPITRNITGIIDFSDTMSTWRINEIAITLAYGAVTPFAQVPSKLVLASLFLGYLGLKVGDISAPEAAEAAPCEHHHDHLHNHHHGHPTAAEHNAIEDEHKHDHKHAHHHAAAAAKETCCGGQHHDDSHHHHDHGHKHEHTASLSCDSHHHEHGHQHEHKHEHQHQHEHKHEHKHEHHHEHQHHHVHEAHSHHSAVPATIAHQRILSPLELSLLPLLIAVRLSTSVMVGAFSIAQSPENAEYLQLHATPGRRALAGWCLGENSSVAHDDEHLLSSKILVQFAKHQQFFQRLYDAATRDEWTSIVPSASAASEEETDEHEHHHHHHDHDHAGHKKKHRWSWFATSDTIADDRRRHIEAIIHDIYDN